MSATAKIVYVIAPNICFRIRRTISKVCNGYHNHHLKMINVFFSAHRFLVSYVRWHDKTAVTYKLRNRECMFIFAEINSERKIVKEAWHSNFPDGIFCR